MTIPAIASYPLPVAAELPSNRVDWTLDPDRAVLLVHDLQEYFLRFYGSDNSGLNEGGVAAVNHDGSLRQQLLRNAAAVRAWAKAQQVPVVYTAQPVEQSASERALLNDMWGPGLTAADPALRAIAAELAPDVDDTVLVKWRYSAFQRSPLQSLMRGWARDQLVIVGIYAHIGCLATALEAFMLDIQPFMVADAVADFSHAEHVGALHYVAGRCGKVLMCSQLPSLSAGGMASARAEPLPPPTDRTALVALLQQTLEEFDATGDGDANLIDFGLDSVQVMTWIGQWRQHGVVVTFEELAAQPTLNGWWSLLASRMAA